MANEFIVSFEDDLTSCNPNFKLYNGTDAQVLGVGISTSTAKFPILWDTIGEISGEPQLSYQEGKSGEDTPFLFLNFDSFKPGETLSITGTDFDFPGSPTSMVRQEALVGSRVVVMFERSPASYGELKADQGILKAVIIKS